MAAKKITKADYLASVAAEQKDKPVVAWGTPESIGAAPAALWNPTPQTEADVKAFLSQAPPDQRTAAFWGPADPYSDISEYAKLSLAQTDKAKAQSAAKSGSKPDPATPAAGPPIFAQGPAPTPSYPANFGLSRGGVAPAHTVDTASKEQIAQQEAATQQGAQAALASNEARVRTGEVVAQEGIGLAGVRQQQAIEAQKAEAYRQAQIQRHLEDQQALMDDIKSEKIDPNKRFKEAGIGSFRAASATLAQVLGSIGASLTGGPNYAKEIVDKTLEDDFRAQVENLNTKKAMLGESRSMLAQKMQMYGDQRAAESAMRADTYAAMQAMADSNIQYAKTDEQRAAGAEISAHFADKAAQENRMLHKYVQASAVGPDPRLKQIDEMAAKLGEKFPNANPEDLRARAAATLGLIPGAGVKPLEDDAKLNDATLALVQKGYSAPDARKLASATQGKIATTGLEGIRPTAGGAGAGRQQAIKARDAMLKTIAGEIRDEIALANKGLHISQEDAAASDARMKALPGAMASAIDGSSSDTKVHLYESGLPGSVGYTGSLRTTDRVARLKTYLDLVERSRKNLNYVESSGDADPATADLSLDVEPK